MTAAGHGAHTAPARRYGSYVMIVVLAVLAVLGMFSDIHSYTGKRLP